MDSAIDAIRKKYGDLSILKLSDSPRMATVDVISTGSPSLDLAIGPGGIPRGRITEIYGPESSGKTTVCQHVIAEAQKQGLVAAFIDVEHATDLDYMRVTGVNTDDLWISQPNSAEEAGFILETLLKSQQVGVTVVDSVAALLPTVESEADMGSQFMGLQARFMSQLMRKIMGITRVSNTAVVFTNQIRMKIGVVYGNPETTSGGRALKFAASVRLDIRRREILKDKEGTSLGSKARIKIVKNKVGVPLGEVMITMKHDSGIVPEYEIYDLGVEHGVLTARGSHIYYGEDRLAQGRDNLVEYLRQNPEQKEEIFSKVWAAAHEEK